MDITAQFVNPKEMVVRLTLEMKLETWMELSEALKKHNVQQWPISPLHSQLRDVILKVQEAFHVSDEIK